MAQESAAADMSRTGSAPGAGAGTRAGERVEVIAIFGPTASGKTAVAEAVAGALGTEVVSADAMQVYRGLPILTNQPERPTRLVGIRSLDEEMSLGAFAVLAHEAIDELVAENGTAVVAGGTGLYLRAALADLDVPPAEYGARPMSQNRAERSEQIARGEASGVMGFADGRAVGWCNASPRTSLPQLDRTPEFAAADPEQTGAIVCYVIAPQYRGQGIARRLLQGACELLRDRGLLWVDAYPPKSAATDAGSYHGRLEMYLDAGFDQVNENDRFVIVRKRL